MHLYSTVWQQTSLARSSHAQSDQKNNGEAERVIRTIMQIWYEKEQFINYYNTVKLHKELEGQVKANAL